MKSRPTITATLGHFWFCLVMLACSFRVSAGEMDATNLPPAAATRIIFARDIRPIFEDNCLRCHGPEKPHSGFRLDVREEALKGGDNGVDILPGDSAHSPLIHYVAYQVEDMEMPPVGRGKQLTPQQISLLRAWIDQGAAWDTAKVTNDIHGSISPFIGGTEVSGDQQKYQELYWQNYGTLVGLDQFQFYQQKTPDTRWVLDGHVLPFDYLINFTLDKNNLGFIHSGWQQYRKYYDDTGGYAPALIQPAPTLNQNLYLDIGKAWIDLGLTKPGWPQMVLGYEYDYRQGNEAITDWGSIGVNPTTARNIAPTSESISEGVHIIKFDLKDDIRGATVTDNFRGQFYHLSNGITNQIFDLTPQSLKYGTTYFEGANTIRVEKKFCDWLFGSAGYLFSKLNANSSFNMSEPTFLQITTIPDIALERESNVGNVNALLGPFHGLTISSGIQAEWDEQSSFGNGTFDQLIPPPRYTSTITPFTVSSSYDDASLEENLSLRYSKISYTGLYAEMRAKQEDMDQHDQFASPEDILNKAVFYQHTAFTSQQYDVRAGFDTSPWRIMTFGADYRFYQSDSQYDSDPLIQPVPTAYPTFILSRDLITQEAEARLVLQPVPSFKTTLTYQYETTEYGLDTRPYNSFGIPITPGGQLTAGTDYSHVFSISATVTPVARLYFSTLFSYELSSLKTYANGSPAVVPYQGDIYTLLADGTYVISDVTDLFAGYFFSYANYGQNNFANGLPLGINYEQNGFQVALTHRFNNKLSAKVQYRYSLYVEPSNGGATNFHANSVFATLTYQF